MNFLTGKEVQVLNKGLTAYELLTVTIMPAVKSALEGFVNDPDMKGVVPEQVELIIKKIINEMTMNAVVIPEEILRLRVKLLDLRDDGLLAEAKKASEAK